MSFADIYGGRRVLVTGHTGFKGSWLTAWLLKLGAEVAGLSKGVPTIPAMFEVLNLRGRVRHHDADVRDAGAVSAIVSRERPDFVFHLAAQAIVSRSYRDPVETVTSNAVGTMNVLEALRNLDRSCVAVLITSDKCYDNVEWVWGYRETDPLGGKDVYSGSKAAAELLIRSYVHSFFQNQHPVRLAVARAGNVIGGGDWAPDRVVADCVRAWAGGRPVEIRSPGATRPWQHVLEPLSGYLTLGGALAASPELHGEAFNFGPRAEQIHTVVDLLAALSRRWGFDRLEDAYRIVEGASFGEAGLLKLNCDKALARLGWEPTLAHEESIDLIADWYRAHYDGTSDMHSLTIDQIGSYERCAKERGRVWAGR